MRTPKPDHLILFFLTFGACIFVEVWDVELRPSRLSKYVALSLEPEGVWE